MSVEKIYLTSSVLTGEAQITALNDGERKVVRLSRTIFHPQGGGQRADTGTIAGVKVIDVRHSEGGEVDHVVETFVELSVGQTVALAVDGEKRRLHARLHSGGHLIADAALDVASHLVAKSGHHWPKEARVEFEGEVPNADAFATALQGVVDKFIAADLPVVMIGDPVTSRQVRVGNGFPVGCGGTHVASLAEIGQITIRKVQQKKSLLRVSYSVAGES
jgi:Ser-tRNA(Ala) deacylase AlaX